MRPFVRLLGESDALSAALGGRRVLAAVRTLPALARRRVGQRPLLPADIDTDLVPPAWRPAVYANRALDAGAVDRDAYVVCVLEQLFTALNRRDVFAAPSRGTEGFGPGSGGSVCLRSSRPCWSYAA